MVDLATDLSQHGFASVDAAALGIALSKDGVESLQEVWTRLPHDPHLPEALSTRRRLHARFTYERQSSRLIRLPHGEYFQSRSANRLYGGRQRRFGPIDQSDLDSNPAIETAISACASALPVCYSKLHIHCHLMRIVGLPELAGEPSPEGIHRDGFDYVSLHLINRINLDGGQSIVLSDDLMIATAPMLTKPFDTLVLDDRRFLHAALPFFVSKGIGFRDMMLCSYEELTEQDNE